MDKNAGSVFEQRGALACLRASLMDEASSPAAEPAGMYLRRLYGTPIISDRTALFFKLRALTDSSLWVEEKGQERYA